MVLDRGPRLGCPWRGVKGAVTASDRDVRHLRRNVLRLRQHVLQVRRSAADPSVNRIEAHNRVREEQEGLVVKNAEDGLVVTSGAGDLRNVVEAVKLEGLTHA